jgi:hypothetical protein
MGPREKQRAFHEPFVTVPSPNLSTKPPSPMVVLAYSMPVFGAALSLAMTAIVIGYGAMEALVSHGVTHGSILRGDVVRVPVFRSPRRPVASWRAAHW